MSERFIRDCVQNGQEVLFLLDSLDAHRTNLQTYMANQHWNMQALKVLLILLGGTATVLLAFKERRPRFADIALVLTAIVTGLTAWSDFQNPQGSYLRTLATDKDLATIQSEIEVAVLKGARGGDGKSRIAMSATDLNKWHTRVSATLDKSLSEYLAGVKQKPS